ncbi:MAG: DNA mismatch repair protein MutS [Flavobacteriaceae bacterium]|nr:DNA mismatch repair protein MutS [Flavobacteriaceae bacterium]
MSFKPGDKVSVLDEDFNGIVIKVEGDMIHIESEEGFPFVFRKDKLIPGNDMEDLRSESLLEGYSKEPRSKPKKTKLVRSAKRKFIPIFEVDLHIEKLLPSNKGMSKHEIRTFQIDTARKQLEFAIRKRIPRMVFIHGVGEGILKVELDYLFGRYDNISFFDADYQQYGIGATEVRIHQNARRA